MKKYVFCFITLVLCLTPVFSQETDSLEPYNEPFVEEKVIGFTPSLRFSLLGLEPGFSFHFKEFEAELAMPVTATMSNDKFGAGFTISAGFNSNPFTKGVQHGIGAGFSFFPKSYVNASIVKEIAGKIIDDGNGGNLDASAWALCLYYKIAYRFDVGIGAFARFNLPLFFHLEGSTISDSGNSTVTLFNPVGLMTNLGVGLCGTSVGIQFTF